MARNVLKISKKGLIYLPLLAINKDEAVDSLSRAVKYPNSEYSAKPALQVKRTGRYETM
jgi:hypothetical protein